jgi:hypothetical protein
MISHVKIKSNKQGQRFAQFDIEDIDGKIHCFIFARYFENCRDLLTEDAILAVTGAVRMQEEDINFNGEEVALLKNIRTLNIPSIRGMNRTRKNEDIDYYDGLSFDAAHAPEEEAVSIPYEEIDKEPLPLPDIVIDEPVVQISKRLYINISPGQKGREEELAARKIFACHRGQDVAYSFYKEKNTVKPFGLTVSVDHDLLHQLESIFGKERIFVKEVK